MSASTYQTILDEIDTAIAAGVSEPGTLSFPNGQSVTYRSLPELLSVRQHYEKLLAELVNSTQPFKLSKIKSGGMR
jgi:hypothetical protein